MSANPSPSISEAEAGELLRPLEAATGVALAVSGGADSLALMHLVAGWRRRRCPRLPVVVLTVDHALRPDSAGEAARVAGWAAAAGLEHETILWRGPKPARDIQAAAREARYRLLADRCAALGLSHLVTAHHLDDQAETLLLRLARGSGVDGLAAMPAESRRPGFVVLRPLLDVPKARLVATLRAAGREWIEDPSNADPRFARARLRAIMPALAGEGLTARRLADTARRMRRARAALEAAAADLHRGAVQEDPAGFCRIDRGSLVGAPEEIGLRVLARLLMGVGGADHPPRLERLERLYGVLRGGGRDGARATLCGCRIVLGADSVTVLREEGRAGLPVRTLDAGSTLVWDRRFRIDAGEPPGEPPAAPLSVRALGAEGLAMLRRETRLRALPPVAARATPALYADERLVAAPLVEDGCGPYSPEWVRISFLGAARFATGGAPA